VAALAGLVGRRPEARPALVGLIDANRMDQSVSRYETFDALLDYCALSAAPVGRLVLEIAGVDSESARRASDDVCNALQVLEHCQDVGEDGRNGRIYLPLADLRAAGVPESAVLAAQTSPALRGVVALQVRRARGLLGSGDQLLAELRGWARVAVAGYVAGGYATAVALERGDYGVLEHVLRPSRRRTATTALRLLARTARR
jgi:phytoene/squalene synthetase